MLPSIRERNLNFVNMTDTEKRVAIAQDVIDQLDAKQLKACFGTYVYENGVSCDVCAIGAAAVSLLNGNVGRDDYRMRRLLADNGFTLQMLAEMEAYFEGWGNGNSNKYAYSKEHKIICNTDDEWNKAADTRLRNCFQHIIDNNGEWDAVAMGGTLIGA